jgi:hypothetical protein
MQRAALERLTRTLSKPIAIGKSSQSILVCPLADDRLPIITGVTTHSRKQAAVRKFVSQKIKLGTSLKR